MRKELLLGFLFGILLFSGCISQTYYQKVERNGNSEIQYTMDIDQALTMIALQSGTPKAELLANMSAQSAEICANITKADSSISCSVEETKIILKRSFTPDGYYKFTTEGGILYTTYKLSVNKIPADKFSVASESMTSGLGQQEKQEVIDLNAKEQNKLVALQMKMLSGYEMKYITEMPGEVTSATAGNAQVIINGSKATFDLLKVMEDSAPLTVESRELNATVLLGIGFVVVLLIVVAAFFMYKK